MTVAALVAATASTAAVRARLRRTDSAFGGSLYLIAFATRFSSTSSRRAGIGDEGRQVRRDADRRRCAPPPSRRAAARLRRPARVRSTCCSLGHVDRIADPRDPLQVLDQPRQPIGARLAPSPPPSPAAAGSSRTASFSSSAPAKISVPIGDRSSWLAARLNALIRSVCSWMVVGVLADEGVDRRPHQHADRARSGGAGPRSTRRRRLRGRAAGFVDEERLEDLAEDFVFVQQLVRRRALAVTQRSELARLVDHRGVGGDLVVGRRGEIAARSRRRATGCDRAAARTETRRWRRRSAARAAAPASGWQASAARRPSARQSPRDSRSPSVRSFRLSWQRLRVVDCTIRITMSCLTPCAARLPTGASEVQPQRFSLRGSTSERPGSSAALRRSKGRQDATRVCDGGLATRRCDSANRPVCGAASAVWASMTASSDAASACRS